VYNERPICVCVCVCECVPRRDLRTHIHTHTRLAKLEAIINSSLIVDGTTSNGTARYSPTHAAHATHFRQPTQLTMCVCVCVCMYAYAYTYTQTHTCTHTQGETILREGSGRRITDLRTIKRPSRLNKKKGHSSLLKKKNHLARRQQQSRHSSSSLARSTVWTYLIAALY
jgi:hypothetical protein